MGMNPDTHQFERLDSLEAFKTAEAKRWKIFKVGEKVTLNGTDFSVQDIQPNKLVLRPYGLSELTAASIETKIHEVEQEALDRSTVRGIGWAVKQLRNGAKVARAGWNGKGMFLILVQGSTFTVKWPPLLGVFPEGTEIQYHAHVDLKNADGKIVPWNASQGDLLAHDWVVVE
jgi:Protein of unknown function (DUF2829)